MNPLHGISVIANGATFEREVPARKLLLDFLREDLGLLSVHAGCEHGVCGTCTVLMNGQSIRSCITLAVQANGSEITTVESLAGRTPMHPLLEAFWEKQALQCGYCTPAMIMRAHEFLSENPHPSREEAREAISSNLCRCTGYQFIVDAVMDAADRLERAAEVG